MESCHAVLVFFTLDTQQHEVFMCVHVLTHYLLLSDFGNQNPGFLFCHGGLHIVHQLAGCSVLIFCLIVIG